VREKAEIVMTNSEDARQIVKSENSPGAHGDPSGLTVVILSYERMWGLTALLKSLLRQNLDGLGLEVMICNNSHRICLEKSWFSRLGRLLGRFPDLKIFNCNHDWHTRVRYGLATMAKYERVLFLDDDIVLLDKNYLRYMFETFKRLGPVDMLSCWCEIWLDWNSKSLGTAALTFREKVLTQLTKVDLCGMGICMFNKSILFHPMVADMSRGDERIQDYLFPVIAAMELGTQVYFVPSYQMLKFHHQKRIGAICEKPGFNIAAVSLLKSLINNGYKPLLTREQELFNDPSSPEAKAAKLGPRSEYPWT